MIKKIIYITICLVFYALHGISQPLKGKKALEIPQRFILPTGDESLKEIKVLPGNTWKVYSDRTFNKTQTTPGGNKAYKALQYLEEFYVAEIKKDYLHIVKDPQLNNDRTFSESLEDYGWISSDKLLLWSHCLVDENNKNKRVYIFRDQDTESYFNTNDNNIQETKYFQILYVFKEDNDKYLLGKSIRISGKRESMDNNIIGWIDKKKVVSFESGVFAEPIDNYSLDFNPDQFISLVFFDKKSLKKFFKKNDLNNSKLLYYRKPSLERINPTDFRFPITSLDDSTATVLCYYPQKQYQNGFFNQEQLTSYNFYKGYCNITQTTDPYSFKEVILLNKIELAGLLEEVESVLNLFNMPYDSTTIATEIKNIFHLNTTYTNSMILSSSIHSFFSKKYGCRAAIMDNTVKGIFLNKNKLNEYIQIYTDKLRLLNSIYNDNMSDRQFMSNGIQYYWITCACIP